MGDQQNVCSCRISSCAAESACGDGGPILPYWSFTKTVIAVCALTLAEQGRLRLDAPLHGQPFTLRQLLGHTAGLPDYGTLPGYHRAVQRNDTPWTRDDLMRTVMAQGMLFPPGAGWSYSNIGYMLARECVEDAAGASLSSIIDSMIGARLGLDSLELATTPDKFLRLRQAGARRYHPGWVYHGCLTGTARDAARLLHALCSGQLLRPESLRQMTAHRPLHGVPKGRPWTECGYGLGLMSGRMGTAGRAIGHSGGGPFSVAAVYHFPDRPDPVTVASFAEGPDEGTAEFAAARLADPGRMGVGLPRLPG